jgi:hypothetical protein
MEIMGNYQKLTQTIFGARKEGMMLIEKSLPVAFLLSVFILQN